MWFFIAYLTLGPVQFGPFETEKQCQFITNTLMNKDKWPWVPLYELKSTSGCWRVSKIR